MDNCGLEGRAAVSAGRPEEVVSQEVNDLLVAPILASIPAGVPVSEVPGADFEYLGDLLLRSPEVHGTLE